MPFTVDSPDLPSNVKVLDAELKAQWVEVFNSVFAKCQEDGGEDCEGAAMVQANGVVKKRQGEMDIGEAVWTRAQINDFPDSSFAIIMPGGEKDDDGKTVPRSLRKLPFKNKQGAVDIPHLRNALSRLPQVKDVSDAQIAKARTILNKAADEHLKTRQEEGMKLFEALNIIQEASRAAIGALADLRAEIEGLELEEGKSGSVMVALELLEQMIVPKDDEEEPDEEEPELEEVVEPEADTASESFAESLTGGVIAISEIDEPKSVRDPLAIKMRLIKAGPGNPADNHYYPGEVLRRDAHVFEGVKMYTTPHNEDERSEDNEVGKIRKIVEFEEDGSPIADVLIFDPAFAEKTRNRAKAGELDSLECSILGKGVTKEGDVEGHTYNVVETIESAQAVDFVPRAGAGGRAVSVSESDKPKPEPKQLELPEPEPKTSILEREKVLTVLRETNLPKPSQDRLASGEYQDEATLTEAIKSEIDYVKSVSGSGLPLEPGKTQPVVISAEERQKADREWYENFRGTVGLSPRI